MWFLLHVSHTQYAINNTCLYTFVEDDNSKRLLVAGGGGSAFASSDKMGELSLRLVESCAW